MKRRLSFSFAFIFLMLHLQGQNLVPNPSFESTGTLPCSWITTPAGFVAAMNNWTLPSNGSSDVFSTLVATTCYASAYSTHASWVGNQTPRTGTTMSSLLTYGAGCGSLPNYREYLQVALISPLVPGNSYDVEMYISHGDNCNVASNNIGFYFSVGSVFVSTCFVITATPQINITSIQSDEVNWVRIAGTFVATTAATHLIIGNFYDNASTASLATSGASINARYFVDDVSVTPSGPLPVSMADFSADEDKGNVKLNWKFNSSIDIRGWTLEKSDNAFDFYSIESGTEVAGDQEFQHSDFNPPNSVHWYRLKWWDENGVENLSKVLEVRTSSSAGVMFQTSPNPVQSGSSFIATISGDYEGDIELKLLNTQGEIAFEETISYASHSSNREIPTDQLTPGLYLITLETSRGSVSKRILVY